MMHRATLLAAGLMLSSPALAAEGGGGMPQLDPTWFPSQLFWLAVSFVALYAVVSLIITPRVAGVLKTRASAIDEAIALAEKLKKEAAATKGNFEQISADARLEASQLIAQAQAEVAKEAATANLKLDTELEAKMATADAEIKKAVTRASANLEAAAIPLAKEMVEKLLDSEIEEAKIRAALSDLSEAA